MCSGRSGCEGDESSDYLFANGFGFFFGLCCVDPCVAACELLAVFALPVTLADCTFCPGRMARLPELNDGVEAGV